MKNRKGIITLIALLLSFLTTQAQTGIFTRIDDNHTSGDYHSFVKAISKDTCLRISSTEGGSLSFALLTKNGGLSWDTIAIQNRGMIVSGDIFSDGTVYLISNGLMSGTIFAPDTLHKSTDFGKTWENLMFKESQDSSNRTIFLRMYNSKQGFLFSTKYHYRTENGFEDVTEFTLPNVINGFDGSKLSAILNARGERGLEMVFNKPAAHFYALTKDLGKTWETDTSEFYYKVYKFKFLNENLGYGVGTYRDNKDSLFYSTFAKTTNGGKKWEKTFFVTRKNLFGFTNIDFADSLHGIATGAVNAIARTTDAGKTWLMEGSEIDTFTHFLNYLSYPVPERAYMAAASRYSYRWDIPQSALGVLEEESLTNAISISPNPARGRELPKVSFKIENQSDVKIELYNSLGSYVQKLYEQANMGVGEYSVNIIDNLPSGAYFVKTRINNKTETEKLVIVD